MMRHLVFVAAALVAIATGALSQSIPFPGPGMPAASGAAYTGPGDVVSGATAFFSCARAYNAAYATGANAACDLVDTATGLATCTISFQASGFVNLTATVCPTGAPTVNVVTFCTVTHVGCSVTKMYDQTGNGNSATQATLALMPQLLFSALNGLPCPAGTGSNIVLETPSLSATVTVPFSTWIVSERTGSFSTLQRMDSWCATTCTGGAFRSGTTNAWGYSNGTGRTLTVADSSPHVSVAVTSSTAPLYAVDSNANTTTATTGTNSLAGNPATIMAAATNGANGIKAGFVCEDALWPSDLNATYQTLFSNARSSATGYNF